MVEAVEALCDVHDMSGYDGRFVLITSIDDDFRQLVQPGNFSARNAHGRVLTVLQDSMLDSWLR